MNRARTLCVFNVETLTCGRCGRRASRLPTYRHCVTDDEVARHIAEENAARRIRLPDVQLGGAVRAVLWSVGITSPMVEKVTGRPCGCKAREAFLNRLGRSAASGVERTLNAVANFISPRPVTEEDVAAILKSLKN